MNQEFREIRAMLETRMLRDAAERFRESVICFGSDWRKALMNLEMAIGLFLAWWWTKLTGLTEDDIEPEVIEEFRRAALHKETQP